MMILHHSPRQVYPSIGIMSFRDQKSQTRPIRRLIYVLTESPMEAATLQAVTGQSCCCV